MVTVSDGTKRFETVEEFVDHLERGDEIEFVYSGKRYWIFVEKEKLKIYCYNDINFHHRFDSIADLLDYSIDHKKIITIVTNVPITHSLFS